MNVEPSSESYYIITKLVAYLGRERGEGRVLSRIGETKTTAWVVLRRGAG